MNVCSRSSIVSLCLVPCLFSCLLACVTAAAVPEKKRPTDALLVVPLRFVAFSTSAHYREDKLTYNFIIDGEYHGAPFTVNQPYAFVRGLEPGKHVITGIEGRGPDAVTEGRTEVAEATFETPFVVAEGRITILRGRLTVHFSPDQSRKISRSIFIADLTEEELSPIRRDLWSYRNIQQWIAEPK